VEIQMVLHLPRDAESVPVSRQVLDGCLRTLGVTADTRADIALALSEACANVILHAAQTDEYEVMARLTDGRCVIEVVNKGGGFAVPAARAPLADAGVALTAEQGGKIRAHIVTMRWDDHLILRSAGFDYEFKGKLPLYYGLAFYHVVEYALATGVREVSYSIESTAAKRSRGCRLVDEYGLARGLDDEAAGALRRLQKRPGLVRAFFADPHLRYITA